MTSSRSSSKRSRDPVVVDDASKLPQVDGSCFGKPAAASEPQPEAETAKGLSPTAISMPSFLLMTEIGKFALKTKQHYGSLRFRN